jgi:pheromone shutdown-related protein TraB
MNFSDNVQILTKENKTYYIIGTAHISQKSVDEVISVIQNVQPDTVCVELCQTRYNSKIDPDRFKKLNIFDIIKQRKGLFFLSQLVISSFQKKMGKKLGVEPGAEFFAAIKEAEKIDAKIILADRDVQATLKRTWGYLGFFKKMALLSSLFSGFFVESEEKISEDDIEKMKEAENLEGLMQEFAEENPEIKKRLIDERDMYLMSHIEEAEGEKIVAVVGAGHVPGMKTHFGQKINREKLAELPKESKLPKILKWVIPIIVMITFVLAYFKMESTEFTELLKAWVLPNGIFAMLGAIIARAKFLTVISSFFISPLTSLNPALPAGVVLGYIEARLRKPTVDDAEKIPEDSMSLKTAYNNSFLRVLIVILLTSVGSGMGAWVGIGWLTALIS